MSVATEASIYLLGMGGLGDGLYQRPIVRAVAEACGEAWLRTPWPQLYHDMPDVHPVPWGGIALRTQRRNQEAQPEATWSTPPPKPFEAVRMSYHFDPPGGSLVDELLACVADLTGDVKRLEYDLPAFEAPDLAIDGPLAVVRPVTARKEWLNAARAPLPCYMAEAAAALKEDGYTVVSVADVDDTQEWFVGELPPADIRLHAGELPVDQLLGLVAAADVAVGGVGWLVPAAIAGGTPAVFVNGGMGGHNSQAAVTHRFMDLSRIRFIEPDRFCACTNMRHDCDKWISDFDDKFRASLAEVMR